MLHRDGAFNPRFGLLRVESRREIGAGKAVSSLDAPHVCRQCEPSFCVEACPAGAFETSEGLGIKIVDPKACTGCRQCFDACPFGVLVFDTEKETAAKCDLCGGNPICVQYCPTGAIVFEGFEEE
jgi:Fe-S-cluster-containing dehydrogenase component